MAWRIKYARQAVKELKALDRPVAARIVRYLSEVASTDDPRARGKALTGNLSGLWRYRVGDHRIMCDLVDEELVVYAVAIDHRSRIYRR